MTKNHREPSPIGFTLDKIKFSVEPGTYSRALKLYETGAVKDLQRDLAGFSATVIGTQPYRVSVLARSFDYGECECYLGQNDTLCKHMVAVAIAALSVHTDLKSADLQQEFGLHFSGVQGELNDSDLVQTKQTITQAIRLIKYYEGPSRTWFAYQNSLEEGCNRLRALFSSLPVSAQTCKLIISTLLRIDKKLYAGVDDSNGVVGGFIQESVQFLLQHFGIDTTCQKIFLSLKDKETSFGWEYPLVSVSRKK